MYKIAYIIHISLYVHVKSLRIFVKMTSRNIHLLISFSSLRERPALFILSAFSHWWRFAHCECSRRFTGMLLGRVLRIQRSIGKQWPRQRGCRVGQVERQGSASTVTDTPDSAQTRQKFQCHSFRGHEGYLSERNTYSLADIHFLMHTVSQ